MVEAQFLRRSLKIRQMIHDDLSMSGSRAVDGVDGSGQCHATIFTSSYVPCWLVCFGAVVFS